MSIFKKHSILKLIFKFNVLHQAQLYGPFQHLMEFYIAY